MMGLGFFSTTHGLSMSTSHCVEKFQLKLVYGAGEMAQCLRALTVLPEDLSSIPSNHMVAHKHL